VRFGKGLIVSSFSHDPGSGLAGVPFGQVCTGCGDLNASVALISAHSLPHSSHR
jgi:hypothetical protein